MQINNSVQGIKMGINTYIVEFLRPYICIVLKKTKFFLK